MPIHTRQHSNEGLRRVGEAGVPGAEFEAGATASTMAMLVAYSAAFPAAVRSFLGCSAVPVRALAGLFVALDMYESYASDQSNDSWRGIASGGGHLVGGATGVLLYGLAIRRGKLPPM